MSLRPLAYAALGAGAKLGVSLRPLAYAALGAGAPKDLNCLWKRKVDAVKPKVTVYSKDYCPYCDRAKALLKSKGVEFEAIELEDRPEEFEKLKQRTGLMTVPQIFIGEELIGGYSDMAALDRDGKLDTKLGV